MAGKVTPRMSHAGKQIVFASPHPGSVMKKSEFIWGGQATPKRLTILAFCTIVPSPSPSTSPCMSQGSRKEMKVSL